MKTFQDLLALGDNQRERRDFIDALVKEHQNSDLYKTAIDADKYDRKQNVTIMRYQKLLYTMSGLAVPDNFSANHKIISGFFPRAITQSVQYLLGNGVTLTDQTNKEKLGRRFDTRLQQLARAAKVGAVAYGFWDFDKLVVFKVTEFAPLLDEKTGSLRAGVRFWQLSADKPTYMTLYEEDGYTDYVKEDGEVKEVQQKRKYKTLIRVSGINSEEYGGENYTGFPIIPLYANEHRQSELVGIRSQIDAYDLIKSGFANDLDDASMIYWTLENAGGMDDIDLAKFVERMKTVRAAVVDGDAGAKAEAHTLDVPYQSREAFLQRLEHDMYKDFQALDVEQLSAGNKTATEINAAYQPLDSKSDDFEYQVVEFLDNLFQIVGIDDTPSFNRSKLINQFETVRSIMMVAPYLDTETILKKLPFLTPDEVEEILEKDEGTQLNRFGGSGGMTDE